MIIKDLMDKRWFGESTKAENVVLLKNMTRFEMLEEYNRIRTVLSGKSRIQNRDANNTAKSFMEAWIWVQNERGCYDIFSEFAPGMIRGVTPEEIDSVLKTY